MRTHRRIRHEIYTSDEVTRHAILSIDVHVCVYE
jgi:hypothetical protein